MFTASSADDNESENETSASENGRRQEVREIKPIRAMNDGNTERGMKTQSVSRDDRGERSTKETQKQAVWRRRGGRGNSGRASL